MNYDINFTIKAGAGQITFPIYRVPVSGAVVPLEPSDIENLMVSIDKQVLEASQSGVNVTAAYSDVAEGKHVVAVSGSLNNASFYLLYGVRAEELGVPAEVTAPNAYVSLEPTGEGTIEQQLQALRERMTAAEGDIDDLEAAVLGITTNYATKAEMQETLGEILAAIQALPDGQAVSAQVALNTAAIEALQGEVSQLGQRLGYYDKTSIVFDGSIANANSGDLTPTGNTDWGHSDYMEIPENADIVVTNAYFNPAGYSAFVFYTDEKEFLASFQPQENTYDRCFIPQDAKYIRLTCNKSMTDFRVELLSQKICTLSAWGDPANTPLYQLLASVIGGEPVPMVRVYGGSTFKSSRIGNDRLFLYKNEIYAWDGEKLVKTTKTINPEYNDFEPVASFDFSGYLPEGISVTGNYTQTSKGLDVTANNDSQTSVKIETPIFSLEWIAKARFEMTSETPTWNYVDFNAGNSASPFSFRYITTDGRLALLKDGSRLAYVDGNVWEKNDIIEFQMFRYFGIIGASVINITKGWQTTLTYVLTYNYPFEDFQIIGVKPNIAFNYGKYTLMGMSYSNMRSPRKVKTVVYGASISSMFSCGAWGNAWQNILFDGHRKDFANVGYPGANVTLAKTMLPEALAWNPKYIMIIVGTNDVLQGVPIATSKSAYEDMIETILARGIVPIVSTLPPLLSYDVSTFNAMVEEVAEKYELVCVDIESALDASTDLVGDGVHPNTLGHSKMAALYAEEVPYVI